MKKRLLTITVIALTVLSISAQSLKYKSLRNEIINYGYTISLERYADLRQGNIAFDWKTLRHNDSLSGSTGDVFPLDEKNKIKLDRDNYFLIRLDSIKNNR